VVDLILEESKKTFRSFYRDEGKEVEKIILAGGTALLPSLKEYFATKLKKEITIVNPFSNIQHIDMLDNALKAVGPSYAIALGLALKGLQ
jgi:type IV pilus assembly protein PilM